MSDADANDMPVIPRGRCEQVGGETLFKRATEAGVIEVHRTPTGRDYITPREFERFVRYVENAKRGR